TLSDLDQLAADICRRLVQKPVQVLIFYQRVREQENEVVCSVLLGNPLGRHPRPYAAREHDNVLHLLHPPHCRRLVLAKQRCLPRAFLLHCEPQDRPSNGLRSLPLVVPQRLLVARVFLPLPLLAADLGGVLAAPHNGVPLCSGPDGVGNSLVDDVLQCHTALASGRPGTSWHASQRGSYMSSPPGRMAGLSHGAGLPSISRWVRVAISPHLAHTAFSMVTDSAAHLR